MKKIILSILLLTALSVSAQEKPKQDSLVVQIEAMDTTTYLNIINLITENINNKTTTGKMVLQNILTPLYRAKLVPRTQPADKPKQPK